MTIITALRSGGRVWMASDSQCEDTEQAIKWNYPGKLAHVSVSRTKSIEGSGARTVTSDVVLVGAAGAAAIGALVIHSMDWPELPEYEENAQPWAQQVGRAFYTMCREHPHLLDPQNGGVQGSFLLAWHDYLWEISADLAIPVDDYASIGSGALAAQGALHALLLPGTGAKWDGPGAVELAAEAAVKHAAGCGGDIVVLST